ncbi:hypothetical protein [Terasakiella sp. SH-1]|uniref:hypothetical protein n=1 Tax=Terasakiella sp. SH-1 TaxID=2560057 RepID=UPI0010740F2E|nr:hypothetical protein [Terasakiella sp. SH-1]
MPNVHKPYLFLLVLVFSTSLYFKTSGSVPSTETESYQLDHNDLTLTNSIKPVNRGNFTIHFYESQSCLGLLAVIALNKNEEGAAILAYYLKRPLSDIQFIFKGKVYNHFPAFSYWLSSLHPWQAPSYVWAVKEFGRCKLIENINWAHI